METIVTAAIFYMGGKVECCVLGPENQFEGVVSLDYVAHIHVKSPSDARELAKAFNRLANDMEAEAANELQNSK